MKELEQVCDFTIEVTGEGVATAVPDETVVTLGVSDEGDSLGELQADHALKIEAIIQALLALGVPRENISTAQYTIEPQYDFIDGKQVFRGYRAVHLLRVAIDGAKDTGRIIDAAVANGANMVSDVTFRSTNADEARRKALTLAVRDAEAKALAIAATLGVSLSAIPCKVMETPGRSFEPVMFKSASIPAGDAGTSIEPGTLSFRASVRVWYVYG
ncbi:SIMPL domain-containing protein [Paenibacillus glycanilyticus]|uniref:SIMPL domain-containing protein n=1 Tax=Paenibacillus glycanilyticus TaxID=126569 RepID=UPI00203AF6BD|nr:SIMPL domain-containing protein [Paenibacillus glycanilyticus]MCM3626511.1 SIMPL domain-containing protein [Paenibacillus glycanilyticus]